MRFGLGALIAACLVLPGGMGVVVAERDQREKVGQDGQEAYFEPPGFNAAEALKGYGVDVESLVELRRAVRGNGTEALAGCQVACTTLSLLYNTTLVSQPSTPDYVTFQSSYWAQQQALTSPRCIFHPPSSRAVAITVLLSRLTGCQFAVKSGGHAAFAGASSIDGGITVDLSGLKELRLDEVQTAEGKKGVALVGSGNLWYDVYSGLEKSDVAVVGGRVSAIGVGGLTLGGGISFFSGLYGWACDNVASYEIVTATGALLNVNQTSHPSLYRALRGGGNNFGIITRFTLYTFSLPKGLMWGGGLLYPLSITNSSVIKAFTNYGNNAPTDPRGALILSFAYAQGAFFASADLQYAEPVAKPSFFDDFYAIEPVLLDTTAVRTQSNLTQQFNASNPNGLRETYWTATFKLTEEMVRIVMDVYVEYTLPLVNVSGIVPACTVQVITVPQLRNMKKYGGNTLGLEVEEGPLLMALWNVMWSEEKDDELVMAAQRNMLEVTVEKAKALGLDNEYIYMNYASKEQRVIASYGEENRENLREVATRYDPTGVFQRLQPKYFKL